MLYRLSSEFIVLRSMLRCRKGELPEFDEKTGTLKSTYREITPLGWLLLSRIDLISDEERP